MLSDDQWQKFGRDLKEDKINLFDVEFQIESYLRYQGRKVCLLMLIHIY